MATLEISSLKLLKPYLIPVLLDRKLSGRKVGKVRGQSFDKAGLKCTRRHLQTYY